MINKFSIKLFPKNQENLNDRLNQEDYANHHLFIFKVNEKDKI